MNPALLDTDTLSFFLRGDASVAVQVRHYLQNHPKLNFSVVTYYEIVNGLLYKDARNRLAQFKVFAAASQIFPVTIFTADLAAEIYAKLKREGQVIGHNDVMIAATAIEHQMALVSHNTRHFSRIEGLQLEDWK